MLTQLYQSTISINGREQSLAASENQPLLIINTATECGLKQQFEGLEQLHQRYKDQGLRVIGFPCDQFKGQEPVANDDMASQCELRFGVTFELSEKINVNGPDTHPIFQALKTLAPGLLGSQGIKWNFTKFLVSPGGEVIKRYGPTHNPAKIQKDIDALLESVTS